MLSIQKSSPKLERADFWNQWRKELGKYIYLERHSRIVRRFNGDFDDGRQNCYISYRINKTQIQHSQKPKTKRTIIQSIDLLAFISYESFQRRIYLWFYPGNLSSKVPLGEERIGKWKRTSEPYISDPMNGPIIQLYNKLHKI